ncbi:hypothetical protein ACWDZX_26880 [Streptomyces collinus]
MSGPWPPHRPGVAAARRALRHHPAAGGRRADRRPGHRPQPAGGGPAGVPRRPRGGRDLARRSAPGPSDSASRSSSPGAGRRTYEAPSTRRTIGVLWDVGTSWPRAAHPFATGGRLVLSGHSQGSVLAAAATWQPTPAVRGRVAQLTYGSPLERLYAAASPRTSPPRALAALHRDVARRRDPHRRTDPIGGPVRLPGDCGPEVDHGP